MNKPDYYYSYSRLLPRHDGSQLGLVKVVGVEDGDDEGSGLGISGALGNYFTLVQEAAQGRVGEHRPPICPHAVRVIHVGWITEDGEDMN